jgi:hypothetical protein
MTIEAVRIEGRHDVRPIFAKEAHELPPDVGRIRIRELTIAIPEQMNVVDADDSRGLAQLPLTCRADVRRRTADARVSRFTGLAACGTNEDHTNAAR